jgi:hypothetical protein
MVLEFSIGLDEVDTILFNIYSNWLDHCLILAVWLILALNFIIKSRFVNFSEISISFDHFHITNVPPIPTYSWKIHGKSITAIYSLKMPQT